MTWKYIPVLNGLLQIIVTIAIGAGVGVLDIISADVFVPQATSFVFNIALPCLIIKGIGIGMDFYTAYKWSFIGVFLILRGIALIIALLVILLTNWKERRKENGIGNVAVLWLSLTWISTVILGIPILSSTFKDPTLGRQYGILAGVSSFIFQLPLQLLFFECHAAEVEEATTRMINTNQVSPNQMNVADIIAVPISVKDETEPDDDVERQTIDSTTTPTIQGNIPPEDPRLWLNSQSNLRIKETQSSSEDDRRWWSLVYVEHLSNKCLWLKILNKVIRNPVLIGICIGFVLSLSTAGTYLRCPSDTCIEGLSWISMVLGWLGNCVSPLSLFTMGLWLHSEGLVKLLSMQIRKLSLYMISKLIIVPLIMVGLATALKLDDEAGRAAILIATLPISMASFSLAKQYNIGEAELATNVAIGTILMLPTVLCWNIVLDKLDLYPIATT